MVDLNVHINAKFENSSPGSGDKASWRPLIGLTCHFGPNCNITTTPAAWRQLNQMAGGGRVIRPGQTKGTCWSTLLFVTQPCLAVCHPTLCVYYPTLCPRLSLNPVSLFVNQPCVAVGHPTLSHRLSPNLYYCLSINHVSPFVTQPRLAVFHPTLSWCLSPNPVSLFVTQPCLDVCHPTLSGREKVPALCK